MSDPSLREIADKVDDVARLVHRQSATLGQLADSRAANGSAAVDVPLLVELHALRSDALTCAATARSQKERAAFTALAGGLERLLVGRGGTVVAPVAGAEFSGATMEAAEIVPTDDVTLDRTVAAVLEQGLQVGGRSVRPARVAVHRTRSSRTR
ncbi:nucleotide exchange factor GrpE [Pseudonocardia sp. CA-107938]|uniref:nucleotide exchange factor GrpE n=1 Tax=Pseudonocardia sp. CA-107938 TaxID=3240021 RepID=UPI003D8A5667